MKVLLICEHLKGTDGWSRHTVLLRGALIERGHNVQTITTPTPLGFLTRPWRAFALAQRLKNMNADVFHFTVEPYALSVLFLPKTIRKRTVLTIHGNYGIKPLRFWMTRFLWPKVMQRIARFITVSEYTRNAVTKELKRLKKEKLAERFCDRVTVVHNGICLPGSKNQKPVEDPCGVTSNQKHILHIGGVKPAKGLGEAIEACARYKELYGAPFHLTVIGSAPEGHYLNGLRSLIRKNDLEDAVTFRGRVSDEELHQIYDESDLLLAPSYTTETSFEGFGLVYIEASAHGVPVIGPNTSGAAEAIKDGVSGYTVDVCDPDAIARKMYDVLDEGKIEAASCRKWAEKFDVSEVAQQVENIYKEVVIEN